MKRILSFLLCALLVAGIFFPPMQAHAASFTSGVGMVTVSSGRLNVRSNPSTSAGVVSALENGSYITLIAKSGSWWQVEYGAGQYGYCHANYIQSVSGSPAAVNIQYGTLNVRSGAGTGYSRVGSLSRGETVMVLSNSGGWSRILYHGTKTGYVSAGYLSTAAYPALSLSVPSYKQTDSRWANTQIGNSGKTMAQIGCTTTAIAMIESYRKGTTIYPHEMAKRLNYTSSGSVYWPSDYTPVTSSSRYLSAIYEQLRWGKPVLFGAKNTSGSQHWVVVTGYTGGSTLTTSGFTIHDPGSNSRTTLQQFLNAYPNFYKYFYF